MISFGGAQRKLLTDHMAASLVWEGDVHCPLPCERGSKKYLFQTLSKSIDNTVVDMTQSGYPASGEINHCNPRARVYTNKRRSL